MIADGGKISLNGVRFQSFFVKGSFRVMVDLGVLDVRHLFFQGAKVV